MGRKRKKSQSDERLIVWRSGRAYGDFRSYEDVGGGRQALATASKSWRTKDPEIANALCDTRLDEMKVIREARGRALLDGGLRVRHRPHDG